MKAFKKGILLCSALLLAFAARAQITQKPGFGKFAITGADIYTVTNGVIKNGVVMIDGKKISYVGKETDIPGDYTQIDASGKSVYPGFIDSGTGLGLQEIGAVAVTNDQNEIGTFKPHILAFTAINPHSAAIPVTRVSGVTTVISKPGSGIISGKAVLINLYGNSPDSMAVLKSAGMVMNWPKSGKRGWWDRRSEKDIKKEYDKQMGQIDDYWDKAIAYNNMMNAFEKDAAGKTEPDTDYALEGMREVLAGKVPVMLSVDGAKNIVKALDWVKKMKKEGVRFILTSVKEGWVVADKIADADVPCIVGPVLSLPTKDYVDYRAAYRNAGKLKKAGVQVALMTKDIENVRNLPFNAGYAANYGMGKEDALKAVTIVPAKIFGVSDKLGSIEKGKLANLFIAEGDPFEPMNHINQVFIKGYKIPMTSRQKQLYEQFLHRDATAH